MLGRSTTPASPPEERKQPLTVQAIPQEFYGGANPVIHFKTTTKEVDINALSGVPVADKKAHDEQSAAGGTNPRHPIHFFSDPKKLLLASAVILGVAVLGGVGYYLLSTKKAPVLVKPIVVPPTSTVVLASPAPTPETVSVVPEVVPVTLSAKLDTPSLLLGDSADDDKDLLTNQEEDIFRTDPGVADTDNDGFLDGHETYFLYSPIQKEPSRLIESGTVTDYANPNFGYHLYYPSAWVVGSVDADNRDVLFSSIGGEYAEVRVFDRSNGASFTDWLAQVAPGERTSDLARFTTRAGESAIVRQDYLVYYFQTADKIIAMLYHATAGQTEISYRTTITMMARSFKAADALETIAMPGTLRQLGERKKSFAAPQQPVVVPVTPSTTEQQTFPVVTTTGATNVSSSKASSTENIPQILNSTSTSSSSSGTLPPTSTAQSVSSSSSSTTGL